MARGLEKGMTLGGRFRLEELVGSGGMGSVYAATDVERGHRVAIKVLKRRFAERTEFRERFVAESRAAQLIPHPHILTVHDHGISEGWHFIAMALAPTDLASMLEAERTLPAQRALNVAEQIAWALDVAHEHGVVHRDVKPENVLVRPRRTPDEPDHAWLADFGIAKLETAERGLTQTGVFVGTVNYASPEQAAGADLDGRSDQYALACVLFECLTGRPPFSGPDADAVLRGHASAPRPAVSAAREGLPGTLDGVLARGMAVAPDERYATCRELVDAARAAVREGAVREPAPTVATEPDPPPPAPAPPGRRRGRALTGVAALVVAAAVATALVVALGGGDDPAPSAPGDPGTSRAATDDPQGARRAIRQTVAAFAAARGAQPACRTLASDRQATCESTYETTQPTAYTVRRIDLGDDVATVAVTHEPDGDRLELGLVREDGTWLVGDVPSFTWKEPEDAAVADVVGRFGRRTEDACLLLTSTIAGQCEALLPPAPVRYDVTSLSVAGREASVQTELASGDRDDYELVDDGSGWRISRID